jgi:hypothetical protein
VVNPVGCFPAPSAHLPEVGVCLEGQQVSACCDDAFDKNCLALAKHNDTPVVVLDDAILLHKIAVAHPPFPNRDLSEPSGSCWDLPGPK